MLTRLHDVALDWKGTLTMLHHASCVCPLLLASVALADDFDRCGGVDADPAHGWQYATLAGEIG